MPYQTPSASQYIEMKKAIVQDQGTTTASSNKFRAPFFYGSYNPFYSTNIVRNGVSSNKFIKTYYPPVTGSGLDFSTALPGSEGGSLYVDYTIPYPTTSISLEYTNLPVGPTYNFAIDSDVFNFEADGSQLALNATPVVVGYFNPFYYMNYTVYSATIIVDNDVVTLTTNSPISGLLHVGIYIA